MLLLFYATYLALVLLFYLVTVWLPQNNVGDFRRRFSAFASDIFLNVISTFNKAGNLISIIIDQGMCWSVF